MTEKLDLNRASASELEKLPGVTLTLARRIVAARDRQGGFTTIAALQDITGVTADLLPVLKENLAVDAAQEQTQVVRVNLDPSGQDAGRYGGYKVTAELVALTVLPGTDEQVAVPRAISGDASVDGLATLTLPNSGAIQGPISFIVRAPDGQILERVEVAKSDLRETLSLPVAPRALPTTQPTDDPAFNQPTKLRGRVIDRAGRVQIAAKQVIIWTARVANPQDADFAPVIVGETDATGYFSGAYAVGQFTSAHATVALDPTQAVQIRLTDTGALPADVILVVDAPRRLIDQPQGDECACHDPAGTTPRNPDSADLVNGTFSSDRGQGRCVDFTRPDRTLQEFSYSYVVRTTEPSLKGLTLAEPTRIPPSVFGEIVKLANLSALSLRTNARASATDNSADAQGLALRTAQLHNGVTQLPEGIELHADVWRKAVTNPGKASDKAIIDVATTSKFRDIVRAIDKSLVVAPDRTRFSCRNPVDWDDEPTIYQACTVAHGHILHFKQEWIADGYSMGRLLYSLPLAPGQKKQIAVLDWERRETAIRQEELEEVESLQATLSRDRDIGEMVNSVLSESSRGGSSASTSAIGGGIGIGAILGPVGGLLGIGGGASNGNSRAWQDSSRNVSANSLQTLRDRTSQAAASMRAQRSTVIQTVTQGERVAVTTESVANYNHCHAMTMEYFEVLRHLIVRQRLVDVQECLFVPLLMSRFDNPKALRWRNTLKTVVPTRDLRTGFDALERIDNNYEGSDMPLGAYADERLDYIEGELTIRFQLARPRDKDDDFDATQWQWLGILLPMITAQEAYRNFLKDQRLKDRIFLEQLGPRIAAAFVDLMKFSWVDSNDVEHRLPIDTTLLSNFTNDTRLAVSLRLSGAVPPVARKDIKFIKISEFALPGILFSDVLPFGSRVIVEGGQMSYRTKFSSGYLFRSGRVANDLTGSDSVRIITPLTLQELRRPREEDKELARRLLDHLNENIERYHHALWWRMSPDRRFMLLDGFESPNSEGRSVASVVDNTLIGIVGNSLIMPVSRGFHLDPMFNQDVERPIDLLEHYQPNTPIEPVRVAIPTRGVYAEAVTGACNSCETKEEERFWRWEESPIPDNPTAILPVSTESRQTPAPDLTAKDFPAPIIAMQNAPAAPDPTGLAGALTLLGQSGLFKDITGLEGNQRNALEALKSSLQTAQFFGGKAADLALQAKMSKDIDKATKTIQNAKDNGLITDAQAQELTRNAISGMIGGGSEDKPKPLATAEEAEKIANTAGANRADVSVKRPNGESVEARTLPDQLAAIKPATEVDLDRNTPSERTFIPDRNDKSGKSSLQAAISNAPPGATFQWTVSRRNGVVFDKPNAGATDILAGESGVTSVSFEVSDAQHNSLRIAHAFIGVPKFIVVREFAGPAYTSHRPAVANSHLFDTVLSEFHLTAQKTAVLTTAKLVCEFLLRQANVRTIWELAPFGETLPKQFQPGQSAESFLSTLHIAGFAPTTRFGATRIPATLGLTNTTRAGNILPTEGSIEMYPGGLDTGVFPEVKALLDEVNRLEGEVAANPGNAGLANDLAAVQDIWTEVVGRVIGLTTAHEIHHLLLADSPGLTKGHTTPPEIDLLSPGSALSFFQWTGVEVTQSSTFPAAGTFVDRGFNGLAVIGEANQGRVDALFPVPPAFPFG